MSYQRQKISHFNYNTLITRLIQLRVYRPFDQEPEKLSRKLIKAISKMFERGCLKKRFIEVKMV